MIHCIHKWRPIKYSFLFVIIILTRGSPISFSGSGIWLISRPGLGILMEREDEVQDSNYDRDTGFGDFNKRESGNVALMKPRFGNSRE